MKCRNYGISGQGRFSIYSPIQYYGFRLCFGILTLCGNSRICVSAFLSPVAAIASYNIGTVAAAGRGTGDGSLYLLSLPENRCGYVRLRSHIRARFPVTRKGPQCVLRPLPRASRDRRYNTLHFARQSGVPKGSAPLESPGVSALDACQPHTRLMRLARKRARRQCNYSSNCTAYV